MRRRRKMRREAGSSVTLLQDAWGPHWGVQFITGITLEKFTVRLYSKREKKCNQLYQVLISLSFFFFSSSSYTSTIQTISCQYWKWLPFFFSLKKINCATKLMGVSCHLYMALYATLKLKSVSSALVTLDFTSVIGEKLSQSVIIRCILWKSLHLDTETF